MKKKWFFFVLGVIGFVVEPFASMANEITGEITLEYDVFFADAQHPDQSSKNYIASCAFKAEYYHEWDNGSSFVFTPFGRIDEVDSKRSHFDIRELNYQYVGDTWELRVGVGKVFWGVTEFVHLVDIINQTDLVENIDGETKLGQPMVHLSLVNDWGTLDLFGLPGFRERTFPGRKGRLRTALVIDTDNAEYESGAEDLHVDWAVRYSHSVGDLDFGIYHFRGTGREPTLRLGLNDRNQPVLIPFYEQIDQTGLDLQYIAGQWLFKEEALYRFGQNDDDYFASVSGFEYTFVTVAGSKVDLSIVGEYAYDERAEKATNPFQNDIIGGVRINVNDTASTEILCGLAYDLDNASKVFSVEAGRRIGERYKAQLQSRIYFDSTGDNITSALRDDDYIRFELTRFF